MKKMWTDEQRVEVVRRCNSAKENSEKSGDILKELGASTSQLCEWRKKFKRVECPSEILEQFEGVEVDPSDFSSEKPETSRKLTITSTQLIVDDYDHCCAVVVALVMSGYTVSQETKDRKHFINYE